MAAENGSENKYTINILYPADWAGQWTGMGRTVCPWCTALDGLKESFGALLNEQSVVTGGGGRRGVLGRNRFQGIRFSRGSAFFLKIDYLASRLLLLRATKVILWREPLKSI